MPKKSSDQLVLIARAEKPRRSYPSDTYFHLHVTIGRLVDQRDDDEWHRTQGTKFLERDAINDLYVKTLTIESQGDDKSEQLYGWGIGNISYRAPNLVDLRTTEAMTKVFHKLHRRIHADSEKYGHATRFADFVTRVGLALDAKGVFVRRAETTLHQFDGQDEWEYRMFPSEGRYLLHAAEDFLIRNYGKKKVEAEAA